MRIKVGFTKIGFNTFAPELDEFGLNTGKVKQVFVADTVTYIMGKDDPEVQNMHKGNYVAVGLAIARRKSGCDVFPIEITQPEWPLLTAQEYREREQQRKEAAEARAISEALLEQV